MNPNNSQTQLSKKTLAKFKYWPYIINVVITWNKWIEMFKMLSCWSSTNSSPKITKFHMLQILFPSCSFTAWHRSPREFNTRNDSQIHFFFFVAPTSNAAGGKLWSVVSQSLIDCSTNWMKHNNAASLTVCFRHLRRIRSYTPHFA